VIPVLLFIIAGVMILGALLRIAFIGKPLGMNTPRTAVISTILSAFYVVVILAAAIQLQQY
jgi:hypothetical protein